MNNMDSKIEGNTKVGLSGFLYGILRQQESNFSHIFETKQVKRQLGLLFLTIFLLSGFYGVVMGIPSGIDQMISSAIKVPVLFLLTLFICFPVLYVVNVLMGSRLSFQQLLALILSALALNGILLASCAPVVVFFIITGSSYHFLKLLHVVIFAFSGIWAMVALWRGLLVMCEKFNVYPKQAIRILKVWIVVFAFVGTQMAWSLRPFVGAPDLPFQIFRKKGGNFYQSVWVSMVNLAQKADTAGAKKQTDESKHK